MINDVNEKCPIAHFRKSTMEHSFLEKLAGNETCCGRMGCRQCCIKTFKRLLTDRHTQKQTLSLSPCSLERAFCRVSVCPRAFCYVCLFVKKRSNAFYTRRIETNLQNQTSPIFGTSLCSLVGLKEAMGKKLRVCPEPRKSFAFS
jgi:hypothetical protein